MTACDVETSLYLVNIVSDNKICDFEITNVITFLFTVQPMNPNLPNNISNIQLCHITKVAVEPTVYAVSRTNMPTKIN